MKVYYHPGVGLVVQPFGKFDSSFHVPLSAHMAEHFFLWSKITIDFSLIDELHPSGIRVLHLLREKIQDPKQKIQIINIDAAIFQLMKAHSLDRDFVLQEKTVEQTTVIYQGAA